jgi:hypothetical protein
LGRLERQATAITFSMNKALAENLFVYLAFVATLNDFSVI